MGILTRHIKTLFSPRPNFLIEDPNVEAFLRYAVAELKKYDLTATFVLNDSVDGCGGWFDPSVGLAVATGCSAQSWYGVLVHEFSHFLQWRDNTPAWAACYDPDGGDRTQEVWNIMAGTAEATDEEFKSICGLIKDLECEAERITVRLLRDLDIPVDLTAYHKASALYIVFYDHIAKHRQWPSESISADTPEEILSLLPDNIYGFDFRNFEMPKELEDYYSSRCYE